MIRGALLLLTLLALAGCSSQSIEPEYYLLRSEVETTTRSLQPVENFALGKITIAPYLDQRGLLIETESGDLRPARFHLWAEPLYEGVRLFLLKEVSANLGKDLLPYPSTPNTTTINARIDQLHGTNDGRAKLVAYWWFERSGDIFSAYQFGEYQSLSSSGYAELARAEKALLSQLAAKIALSVGEMKSAAQ